MATSVACTVQFSCNKSCTICGSNTDLTNTPGDYGAGVDGIHHHQGHLDLNCRWQALVSTCAQQCENLFSFHVHAKLLGFVLFESRRAFLSFKLYNGNREITLKS